MTIPITVMQDLRQGMIALLRELQSGTQPRNASKFRAQAEQIATLKIEIANLELKIIVAGGKLY